ncbi:MAG: hypothetical protein WAV22_11545 [Porticoccaceae bacterium]
MGMKYIWTLAHPVKVALNPILGFIARSYRCGFDASESTMSATVRRDAFLASGSSSRTAMILPPFDGFPATAFAVAIGDGHTGIQGAYDALVTRQASARRSDNFSHHGRAFGKLSG